MRPLVLFPKQKLSKEGGLEKQLCALMRGFDNEGYEIVLSYSHVDPDFNFDPGCPVKMVHLPSKGWTKASSLLAFEKANLRWLSDNPAKIVFGIERTRIATHLRLGDGLHLQYLKNRPSSWIPYHLQPKHAAILRLEKEIFSNPRIKLIANSSMVMRELLTHYHVDKQRITTVINGVEWAAFEAPFKSRAQMKARIRSDLHIRSDLIALFVGNDFTRKGLAPLIEALHHHPNIHLLVIGDDRKQNHFENLAHRWQVNSTFLGKVNPLPYYQSADLFILPTFYDPCANTTLEALAMGLYTLTSSSNGASELITPQSGAIFKQISPACISETLKSIYPQIRKISPETIRDSIKEKELQNQIAQIVQSIVVQS